jgi:hypothetical protein
VYFNALLASLNARHKLREITCNGDTIVFDTLRFGSPVISSPSRKVDKNETDTRTSEVLEVSNGSLIMAYQSHTAFHHRYRLSVIPNWSTTERFDDWDCAG